MISQRLAKRICTGCKIDDPLPPAALVNVGFTPELAETVVPKKGKGCVPPGHAKRWAVGRPLPPDVIFYEVPRDLIEARFGAVSPDMHDENACAGAPAAPARPRR